MTAFKRFDSLMAGIALAFQKHHGHKAEFEFARDELINHPGYGSRGKGGKFPNRSKVTGKVIRSRSKPHQGKQECARRIQGKLPTTPRRMWVLDGIECSTRKPLLGGEQPVLR